MNPLLLAGIALNAAFTGLLAASPETVRLAPFVAVPVLIQLIGLCLIALGKDRPGALAIFWTSVLMLPLGIVAAFGARRHLDEGKLEDFESRRAFA